MSVEVVAGGFGGCGGQGDECEGGGGGIVGGGGGCSTAPPTLDRPV